MRFILKKMNLDGTGWKTVRVFPMQISLDYWSAVTDVVCPICLDGIVVWYENGFIFGYRICNKCNNHFLAGGDLQFPYLILVETNHNYFRLSVKNNTCYMTK